MDVISPRGRVNFSDENICLKAESTDILTCALQLVQKSKMAIRVYVIFKEKINCDIGSGCMTTSDVDICMVNSKINRQNRRF